MTTRADELAPLIAQVQELQDHELLYVLREVFAKRKPSEDAASYDERLFLGSAYRWLQDDSSGWQPWNVGAVAYPDKEHYNGPDAASGPDWGFCQEGTCRSCGIGVSSNVKHGICPVCSEKVYMT